MDLKESSLCGYLHIKGLTDVCPELSTYFEAEIIGPKHGFLTRKWEADEFTDRQHWSKFPGFQPYETRFNQDGFKYDCEGKNEIFMRWKGLFVLY